MGRLNGQRDFEAVLALSFTSPDRNERFAIDQRKVHWGIVRVSLNASDHCPPQPRLGLSDNAQLINADGVFGTHRSEAFRFTLTMPQWAFYWSIAKRSLRSGEVNDKAETCLKIALSV